MSVFGTVVLAAASSAAAVVLSASAASAQTTTSTGGGLNTGVVLVVGAVFAVACGLVAKNKNRSVVLWAVLGFLFGFIPLIIIAVLKRKEPAMPYAAGGGANIPLPPPPPPPG
jgi:heme/copper-type cytochrome/quinol oxidase subunit 3